MRWAFGIQGPVNVDAAAHYQHQEPGQGGIYLSFEDTEMTYFGAVQDGDILFIPDAAIGWANSGYDGALVVGAVAANSGTVAMPEAQVDSRVQNANVADSLGVQVPTVEDTDGLTLDPQGGFFQGIHPHLWFSGEDLDGCSMLTTAGGGTIVNIGGVPMGQTPAAATDGAHLKLVATKETLDGLAVTRANQCHLAVDTPTPVSGGAPAIFEIGGGIPGTASMFLLGGGIDGCGPDPVWFNYGNCGFQEGLPLRPRGERRPGLGGAGCRRCAVLTLPMPALVGVHLRAQGLSLGRVGEPVLERRSDDRFVDRPVGRL